MTLPLIAPRDAAARLAAGDAVIVDIREADEYARSHIGGAQSLPLSIADTADIAADRTIIFTCRSGGRTAAHCGRLAQNLRGDAFILDGGILGWRKAGLPLEQDRGAPLEMMRQVQIAAGSLVLLGLLLGWLIHPAFLGVSAFVGAGLTFAGISGFCGMANMLGLMPWNRRAAA